MLKTISTKKLPSEREGRPKTLIIISGKSIARAFITEKDEIQEFAPIHSEETEYKYTDKEGFSYINSGSNTGIGTTTGYKGKNTEHYTHVYATFLMKEIIKLDQQYQPEHIRIYIPKRLKKDIEISIPNALKWISRYQFRMH